MSSQNNLTIILVTFYSEKIIQQALQSLTHLPYQIVVVDNSSKDRTVDIVKNNFPQIDLIISPYNMGYGRANNLALKKINTNYALLLNPDAHISSDDIAICLQIMQNNHNIAIAGPIVYNAKMQNNNLVDNGICLKKNKKSSKQVNENYLLNQFITGAGMFFNMSIMRKIGFFDEGFFLYCEDNEICKRVIKKGYHTALIKNTKILHLGSKSSDISLAEIEKTYWHRFGWSKLYYTEKIWGKTVAKLRAIRMLTKFSLLCLKQYLFTKTISKQNSQALKGTFAYFCGSKAFDNQQHPFG